jgi:hypothetical protein
MAVIPPPQVQVLYSQGGTDLIAKLALRDFQTGDTLDVTTAGIAPAFTFIRFAILMSFSANKASLATAAGTVVTIPAGFPPNSSAYLDIGGC